MKKVWIASILATLMLTVPLTSVVSANEVEECNCKPTISDLQVIRIERLLNRLESRINFILLKYGHIPEVKEKCEEILDIISSDILWDFPIICSILEHLFDTLWSLYEFLCSILGNHPNNFILHLIIYPIQSTVVYTLGSIMIILFLFGCWEWDPYLPLISYSK